MNYEEAKKTLLHAIDSNPASHPMLEEALEVVLFEAVKAAGKKAVPEPEAVEPEGKKGKK